MPIYEYECQKCQEIFETIVSSTSQQQVACSKCGSEELRKLISATGIHTSNKSSSSAGCQPRGGFS